MCGLVIFRPRPYTVLFFCFTVSPPTALPDAIYWMKCIGRDRLAWKKEVGYGSIWPGYSLHGHRSKRSQHLDVILEERYFLDM